MALAVRERAAPSRLFLLHGGLRPAGAPGAVGDLVAIPGASCVLPRRHHDLVLRTPPRFQAARDQPGPHERLYKRGQALFRDDIQAHLVVCETLLRARVIEEETQLPVDPTPIFLVISKKLLHGLSPCAGRVWLPSL